MIIRRSYRRILFRLALLLVLSSTAAACGWHLRGSFTFPESMESLYVQGAARYSELGEAIHNAFQGSNTTLVESPVMAKATLHILADKPEQRILATDSSGRASEYEISYLLRFRVLNAKGDILLDEQEVRAKREYRFDPNNVLASGGEVERLKKDMVENGVQQMLRRINLGLRSTP